MFKILSLDGGGMRGIFTAQILTEIENQLGINLYENFDLFSGTSTGGILSCGLASNKYRASDIVNIYEKDGQEIFSKSSKLKSFFGFAKSKYGQEGIRKVLEKNFTDLQLKDLEKKIFLSSINITNNRPVFFKNYGENDTSMKCVEALLGTTSAPTYFPPLRYKENDYIDGGLVCNNPSSSSVVEGLKLGFKKEEIKILSIGTGFKKKKYKNSQSWGLVQWLPNLIEILFDMNIYLTEYQLDKMLDFPNYLRLNSEIIKDDLDCTESEYLEYLKIEAKKNFEKNRFKIEEFFEINNV